MINLNLDALLSANLEEQMARLDTRNYKRKMAASQQLQDLAMANMFPQPDLPMSEEPFFEQPPVVADYPTTPGLFAEPQIIEFNRQVMADQANQAAPQLGSKGLDFVPGVGMVDRATGQPLFSAEGEAPTDYEAGSQQALDDTARFIDENYWKSGKSYDYRNIYGTVDPKGSSTPSFLSGPNSQWGPAMRDRLERRRRGEMEGIGNFEGRISTADEDYQRNLLSRNNAIEEMYRSGYSMDQIDKYMKGEVDRNNFQPDWKDYHAEKAKAFGPEYNVKRLVAALSGKPMEDPGEFWGDSYFKGKPPEVQYSTGKDEEDRKPTAPKKTGGLFSKYINV